MRKFSNGITLLELVVHSIRKSKYAGNNIALLTSINPSDNELVALAERLKIQTFRGDENNVLEKIFSCANKIWRGHYCACLL